MHVSESCRLKDEQFSGSHTSDSLGVESSRKHQTLARQHGCSEAQVLETLPRKRIECCQYRAISSIV